MTKAIVNPPAPDLRYIQRLGWKDVNVIGGVAPTGKFPHAVGSGVFGVEGQDEGIFDGPSFPKSLTGIFYNDYAKDSWETQQRDLEWQMLRRPGCPLYPGSSARGIVLVGPSMGNENGTGEQQTSSYPRWVAGAALAAAAYFIVTSMLDSSKE
ncbi:MAG: hypothetical protein ACYSWO_19765 [Planctomycetota bacterium]|jgi:hypothetical protein